MLKLNALTPNQKILLEYLDKNASEALREKINNGTKTLDMCWGYIVSQAKQKPRTGSCVAIEDKEVFGWAVHFFEEDAIEAAPVKIAEPVKPTAPVKAPKAEKVEEPKKKEEKPKNDQLEGQTSIFDLFGGM